MEKSEQPKQERLESAEVKTLSSNEIDQAIECFANAIARDWPNSKEEAADWVFDEFHHPDSIILGVFAEGKIIGTCSLVSLDFILGKLSEGERELVSSALKRLAIDLSKAIYMGGFSVEEKYEARGVGRQLFTSAENSAINKGCEVLVAHTARSSEKYSKIKVLPIALAKFGMKELVLSTITFHLSPNDLEKVWLYKIFE
jgi:GNAT superfamily N-acetyltransferase